MDRREFLKTAGAVGAASSVPGMARAVQPAAPSQDPRDVWIAVMRRLADPVLTNLANGTLKARMPVEQAPGTPIGDRSRTWKRWDGSSPASRPGSTCRWTIPPKDAMRADYAQLARRAIGRAVDPSSPDFLNFTRDRQPLVDAAFLAQGLLRAPRALRDGLDAAAKRHLIAALESTRPILPGFNNWLLFSAMIEAALKSLGADWDRARVDYAHPSARTMVQGRRRLRRRTRVPLGLLQQLRDSPDADRCARRMPRRVAGMDRDCGPRGPARERATPRSRSG